MATNIDSNAWYQLTESRVDFNSSLQVAGSGLVMAAAGQNTNQFWQVFSVGTGQYVLRNKVNGINKQLATCFSADEKDPSHTQPCMANAIDSDSQKWTITTWPDGAYKFVNVGNGTGYNMDCHPGNPMFMSSITAAAPRQPAQHWLFSSLSAINDGAYSTTITDMATSSSSSSPSSTSPASTSATTTASANPTSTASAKSSSVSQGAAAGIGIGVGLLVCAVAGLILFITLRRKRQRRNVAELDGGNGGNGRPKHDVDYKFAGGSPRHEMYQPPVELPAPERPQEMNVGYNSRHRSSDDGGA